MRGVKFLDCEYDNEKIKKYIDSQGIELKQWSTYLFPSYHSYDSFLPEIENRAEDNARITRYANRYCKKVKPPTAFEIELEKAFRESFN